MALGRVAIIGAGPTGLGAAYRLRELGHSDFAVYEAASRVGGLAASHRDALGFTWDTGGHVQFSHYPYFTALMDRALGPDGWLSHERSSWVLCRGRYVPYPFQNNLGRLSPEDRERCLSGLEAARAAAPGRPAHFADWIERNFGRGISELFLSPYNAKVWAHPLETMDYGWVGERVAVPNPAKLREDIRAGRDDAGWGPNNRFRFPKRGGTGAVWEAVADLVGRDKIRLRAEVVAVHAGRRELRLADGSRERFEALLNTSPLDVFAPRVEDLPASLKEDSARLVYSSVHVVGVALSGRPSPAAADKSWIYFPDADLPFYRVTVFSNYSPENVAQPGRQWSLMAEASESPHRPVDAGGLPEAVVEGLLRCGLIERREQVLGAWHHRERHGYPTPFLGRDELLSRLDAGLEALGLSSRGRFGGWKYEVSNQDHSLMQGVEWVDRVRDGTPERTYPYPERVNAQRG